MELALELALELGQDILFPLSLALASVWDLVVQW